MKRMTLHSYVYVRSCNIVRSNASVTSPMLVAGTPPPPRGGLLFGMVQFLKAGGRGKRGGEVWFGPIGSLLPPLLKPKHATKNPFGGGGFLQSTWLRHITQHITLQIKVYVCNALIRRELVLNSFPPSVLNAVNLTSCAHTHAHTRTHTHAHACTRTRTHQK